MLQDTKAHIPFAFRRTLVRDLQIFLTKHVSGLQAQRERLDAALQASRLTGDCDSVLHQLRECREAAAAYRAEAAEERKAFVAEVAKLHGQARTLFYEKRDLAEQAECLTADLKAAEAATAQQKVQSPSSQCREVH